MATFEVPADLVAYIKNLEAQLSSLGIRVTQAPAARVYTAGNVATGASTVTAVAMSTVLLDNAGLQISSTKLASPSGGTYAIGGGLSFAANNTGVRVISLRLNGSLDIPGAMDERGNNGASEPVPISIATMYPLNAGDYVELTALQNSGGSLNVVNPALWMYRI